MAVVENPTANEQVDLTTIPVSPGGDKPEGGVTSSSDDVKTVFHDKENFNVKHPLQNKWTLWFTKPPSGKVCRSPSMILMVLADMLTILCRATTGMICSRRSSPLIPWRSSGASMYAIPLTRPRPANHI